MRLDPISDTGASNADGLTNLTTVNVIGVADVPGHVVNLYLDGATTPVSATSDGAGTATPGRFSIPVTVPTPAGASAVHTVVSKESDPTTPANETASATQYSFTVDTTLPVDATNVTLTPDASVTPSANATPILRATLVDAGSTGTVYRSPDCSAPEVTTATAAQLASGIGVAVTPNTSTIFSVRVTDAAGNPGAGCAATAAYVHDGIAPSAPTLTTNPASPAVVDSVKVHGTAETGSTIKLYASADCTPSTLVGSDTQANFTSTGITGATPSQGTYQFSATATDAAGNVSPCSLPLTFVRPDVTAPTVSITAGPSGTTATTTVAFEFTANEPATFECALASGGSPTFTACVTGVGYGPLGPGAYTFSVRATDTAGNPSTVVTRNFTVPTPPPPTTTGGTGTGGTGTVNGNGTGTTTPTVVSTSTTPTGTTIQYIIVNGQTVPATTVNGQIVRLLGAPSMVTRQVRMTKKGDLVLLVRCTGPQGGACSGSIDVVRRIPANTATGAKARTVRYARKQMVALTGQTVRITVRLSAAGRAAVTKAGALPVLSVVTPAGAKASTFPLRVRTPLV